MIFIVLPSVFIPAFVHPLMPVVKMAVVCAVIAPSIRIIPVMMPEIISEIEWFLIITRPEYRLAGNYLHMRG
jgi:hypothetical protein